MIINEEDKERLMFLRRVITKEIKYLHYSQQQVFKQEFTLEQAKKLETDNALAEKVEAFTSRYSRLQDTVGDKLLPLWLKIQGEKTGSTIDNLDKAEKLGILSSVETWMMLRQLRNQLVHEYIEDLTVLVNAMQTANAQSHLFVDVFDNINDDLDKRER
ncbi:MAG: hypothetical protein KAT04_03595 [Methylococcales bacterium]|nr:hypothetical protein [Methylococcales bacterium]